MKKLFIALTVVALATSCDNMDDVTLSSKYVIKGFHETNADSRTAFGTPNSATIPFLWSSGDYIWLGASKSDAITSDCQIAQFTFSNGSPAFVGTGHVFYNLTGKSNEANVLNPQTADGNLGNDGDFGYATLDAYGSFCLKHKTSYIWFNTTTEDVDMPKLTSIKLDADGVNIAGKQTYDYNNDEWSSNVTGGSSTITLNFEGGHTLVSSNAGVMAAMVCLPAAISGKTLTVTYTFEDGSTFVETKNPTKDLAVGATTRITTKIAKNKLVKEPSYELRVLTFEDGTQKFSAYTITGYDGNDYYDHSVTKWSDLIDTPEYGGPLAYGDMGYSGDGRGCDYNWYDNNNTFLASEFPVNYNSKVYWGGGHVISNYATEDYTTYGTYENQQTVYGARQEYGVTKTGGRNGSSNFAMHFGYIDGSPYNMTENLPYIYFKDNTPRIIDHMYVNNSAYAISCYMDGNGLTAKIGEEDWVKAIATGYDIDDNVTGTAEIYLCNGPDNIVTEWTKWDLTSLGMVYKVEFNITGSSDNGYGFSQPAYFAYDDVAVRFEK